MDSDKWWYRTVAILAQAIILFLILFLLLWSRYAIFWRISAAAPWLSCSRLSGCIGRQGCGAAAPGWEGAQRTTGKGGTSRHSGQNACSWPALFGVEMSALSSEFLRCLFIYWFCWRALPKRGTQTFYFYFYSDFHQRRRPAEVHKHSISISIQFFTSGADRNHRWASQGCKSQKSEVRKSENRSQKSEFPTSDFRFPTFRLPTSDFRKPPEARTSDFRLP